MTSQPIIFYYIKVTKNGKLLTIKKTGILKYVYKARLHPVLVCITTAFSLVYFYDFVAKKNDFENPKIPKKIET